MTDDYRWKVNAYQDYHLRYLCLSLRPGRDQARLVCQFHATSKVRSWNNHNTTFQPFVWCPSRPMSMTLFNTYWNNPLKKYYLGVGCCVSNFLKFTRSSCQFTMKTVSLQVEASWSATNLSSSSMLLLQASPLWGIIGAVFRPEFTERAPDWSNLCSHDYCHDVQERETSACNVRAFSSCFKPSPFTCSAVNSACLWYWTLGLAWKPVATYGYIFDDFANYLLIFRSNLHSCISSVLIIRAVRKDLVFGTLSPSLHAAGSGVIVWKWGLVVARMRGKCLYKCC